jgi:RND family efflux transporter MFP subunit
MQSPDNRPADPPKPPVDLARLRIQRGDETKARVRGFPWLTVVMVVGVLALLALLRQPLMRLVGMGPQPVRTAQARRVLPGQAQTGDVSANGYIVADKQASLASPLSGRLVELDATEGDMVQKGQVVARLQYDDVEAQQAQSAAARKTAAARLAEARAQAAAAQARIEVARRQEQADRLTAVQRDREIDAQKAAVDTAQRVYERLQRDVERNRALREQERIDAAEWDRIQTAARTAANDLDAARKKLAALQAGRAAWDGQIQGRMAALAVARDDAATAERAQAVAAASLQEAVEAERLAGILVEKTRIRAPFTGLVIRKDAEEGEVIAPMGAGNARGSVLTIVDPTSLEVQVELSERRIRRVTPGDRAVVYLDADPEHGLPGSVRKIWPHADRAKGSIEVRVKLDAIPPELRPDMAARVVFTGKETPQGVGRKPYVTVPRAAVVRRGDAAFVFVVSEARAHRTAVETGETRGTDVVVHSGLEGGEQVVLDPPGDLQDGAAVRAGE